jgi:diguanylate cyclase (GGDEF)-like protein/PAS domain S-box-containing protein
MAKALEKICVCLELSRAYIFLDGADGTTTSTTHEWYAAGVSPLKESLRSFRYPSVPSWRRVLAEDGHIVSPGVSALPEDIRDFLEPLGIMSLQVHPLLMNGAVAGFVGFDDCRRRREWVEDETEILRLCSTTISSLYQHQIRREGQRTSEDNFRQFFNSIEDLMIVCDPQGRIMFTNAAVGRKLGFSVEELGGMEILDLYPGDRRDEVAKVLDAMFRKEMDHCPLEFRKRDGGRLPVETRVQIGQWDGQDCIFGISKDLSSEQAALQKYTRLFESNPSLIAITSLSDGVFVDVNPSFLENLGYTRDEVIGKTLGDLNLFGQLVQRRKVARDLADERRISETEMEVRRKDGRILEGLFSGEIIDIQGKKFLLTVIVDITDQVDLRGRLENQRRRLRNIISGANMGTWEWEIQTGKTVCDERWAGILGYSLAELAPLSARKWRRRVHPDDIAEARLRLGKIFSGESEFFYSENRMRHKDGHWVWVMSRGKVFEWNDDRKPIRMCGTNTDITESKELEERIRQISIRDPLTEIYNRRYVFERLGELASEYSRVGRNFCVSILDIDHFKDVNDRYGHQAGDFVLKKFTAVIDSSIRPYDLLGRYGGEEFIIVSTNTGGGETLSMLRRIMETVRSRPFVYKDSVIKFTFSCGIADSAEFAAGELTIAKLVDIADRRLYEAKENGRNRVEGP